MKSKFRLKFLLMIFLLCLNSCREDSEKEQIAFLKKNNLLFYDLTNVIYRCKIANADPSKGHIVISPIKRLHAKDSCDYEINYYVKLLDLYKINIEHNFCSAKVPFDLIILQTNVTNVTGTYYYYYSYCIDTSKEKYENSNTKQLPLDNHWSLFIEK